MARQGSGPGHQDRCCGGNLGPLLWAEQSEVKPRFQTRKGHVWSGATECSGGESTSEMYLEKWVLTSGGPEGEGGAGRALPGKRK